MPSPEERPSPAQRQADALVAMAESFLAATRAGQGGDRHLVSVHVDAQVLATDTDSRCELEDGPVLAAETARRLACDAAVVTITEDEHGTPLDVGRRTRTISPALRRALQARDQGCRFPGCTNRRFVDGHHIQHWARGGHTSLANLVSACRVHHRALHEGAYRAEATGDPAHPVVFRRPDGTLMPEAPRLPAGDATVLVGDNRRLGLDIGPTTGHPLWAGEHLDLGLALEALFSRRASRPNAPPGR